MEPRAPILASWRPAWIALVITGAALIFSFTLHRWQEPDLPWPAPIAEGAIYAQMAQGDYREAISPFNKRVLYPFLAGRLAAATGLGVPVAFLVLAGTSFFLGAWALARLFQLMALPPVLTAVWLWTPFSLGRLDLAYFPDILHDGLLAWTFLFLWRERIGPALLLLALAYTVRESTLIVGLFLLALAVQRRRPWLAAGTGLVLAFGTIFGALCTRGGRPNIHHLPDFVYLAAKLPHEFLKNVLGLRVWTNTLPVGEPVHRYPLPHALQFGEVREIGLCPLELALPFFTLIVMLTLFGTGPLLLAATRRAAPWRARQPLGLQLAAVYGVAAWLLGPAEGDWVERLVGYGWPLFWVALPWMLARAPAGGALAGRPWIWATLFATAWVPALVHLQRQTPWPGALAALLAMMVLYLYVAARLSGRARVASSPRSAPGT